MGMVDELERRAACSTATRSQPARGRMTSRGDADRIASPVEFHSPCGVRYPPSFKPARARLVILTAGADCRLYVMVREPFGFPASHVCTIGM